MTQFGLATRSGRALDPERNPHDLFPYVYLATPDSSYHVGLDMASALHPQTLLCDTMNGQPLTREHGAPLRLYLAVKYGYKSLKRLALIRFQDKRPSDYWAARGYDWYAGL
jgi:DMSO/TMAO reductase YedYZ molybdopterin-dependent catalytic subunit